MVRAQNSKKRLPKLDSKCYNAVPYADFELRWTDYVNFLEICWEPPDPSNSKPYRLEIRTTGLFAAVELGWNHIFLYTINNGSFKFK